MLDLVKTAGVLLWTTPRTQRGHRKGGGKVRGDALGKSGEIRVNKHLSWGWEDARRASTTSEKGFRTEGRVDVGQETVGAREGAALSLGLLQPAIIKVHPDEDGIHALSARATRNGSAVLAHRPGPCLE